MVAALDTKGGSVIWSTEVAYVSQDSVAVIDGTIVTASRWAGGSRNLSVTALDEATGELRWAAPVDFDFGVSVRALGDDLLISNGRTIKVHDPFSGQVLWETVASNQFAGPRGIYRDVLADRLFVYDGGVVQAVAIDDGARLWTSPLDPTGDASFGPRVESRSGLVFQGLFSGTVFALDPSDGSIRWRFDAPGGWRMWGGPIPGSGVVVVPLTPGARGSRTTTILAFDADRGTEIWRREVPVAGLDLQLRIFDDLLVESRSGSYLIRDVRTGDELELDVSNGILPALIDRDADAVARVRSLAYETWGLFGGPDPLGTAIRDAYRSPHLAASYVHGLLAVSGGYESGFVANHDLETGDALWLTEFERPIPFAPSAGADHLIIVSTHPQVFSD